MRRNAAFQAVLFGSKDAGETPAVRNAAFQAVLYGSKDAGETPAVRGCFACNPAGI